LEKNARNTEKFHPIILRNGYSKNSPSCVITAFLDIGKGNPDWGAVEGKEYYILKIVDRQVV
jgi:hypothetical protein